MVFLRVIIVPVIRRPEYQDIAASLMHWLAMRFRRLGWVCLFLLIASGVFNVAYRGFSWADV